MTAVRQLDTHIQDAYSVDICFNIIVNVILEEKIEKAKKEGISIDIDVRLPQNMLIETVDLCSIFANLLDNAICAAAICEKDKKEIQVLAYIRSGYCVIKIRNIYNRNVMLRGKNTD